MKIRPLTFGTIECNALRLTAWDTPGNAWPFWRFWWNRQTGAQVSHEGRSITLGPDRMVAVPPMTTVKRILDRPLDHFWLHTSLHWPYDRARRQLVDFPLADNEQAEMDSLAREVEANSAPAGPPTQTFICLQHWILRVLRRIPSGDWHPSAEDSRICATLEAMDRDLKHDWSNPELAGIACLSLSAFAHLFKQETGESPQAWLTRRRLEHACLLLLHSDSPIELVASECGICNRYYLSRLFSNAYGMGPAAWRKQRRNEPESA